MCDEKEILRQICQFARNSDWSELVDFVEDNPGYSEYLFTINTNNSPRYTTSPFHHICSRAEDDTIKWCITKALHPSYLNRRDEYWQKTPLEICKERNKGDIVSLLVQKTAQDIAKRYSQNGLRKEFTLKFENSIDEIDHIKMQYKEEIENIKRKHEDVLKNMKIQHELQLHNVRKEHEEELKNYKKELENIKQELKGERKK